MNTKRPVNEASMAASARAGRMRRLKRVATRAEEVFGDPAKARRWMRKPKRSLLGETPLAYLASEDGARVVEEMLGRIEHGIFA